MNAWFTKKFEHLATWNYPATKQWHMIDYVMMRADQRQLCCDVQVMRGASCWTDHTMIRGKARIHLPFSRTKRKASSNVPLAVHLLHDQGRREAYQHKLDQCLLDHPHNDGYPAERNWTLLKECIMETAEECVGRNKQPDWFMEARSTLQPILEAKHQAHHESCTPIASQREESTVNIKG